MGGDLALNEDDQYLWYDLVSYLVGATSKRICSGAECEDGSNIPDHERGSNFADDRNRLFSHCTFLS